MLRLDADLLVGQVNVELHSCGEEANWDVGGGSRTLPLTGTKKSASLIIPITPGFSPGVREQRALSVLGTVSVAGSTTGYSLCVRNLSDGA